MSLDGSLPPGVTDRDIDRALGELGECEECGEETPTGNRYCWRCRMNGAKGGETGSAEYWEDR